MSAIATKLPPLDLFPLPADALPPGVQTLVQGPAAAKVMAAKGLAPLRPAELVLAAYQLTFDADEAVKAAAGAAPTSLPERVVVPALSEPLPALVLHFFARFLPAARTDAFEKILYNQSSSDQTFVVLAGRLKESQLEIIFQNEARWLRSPEILEALYMNTDARSSSLNRALELAARNGLKPEGIPAFEEIVKSIAEDPVAQTEQADQAFVSVLQAVAAAVPEEGEAAPVEVDEKKSTRKKVTIDFGRLKLHEKIRLATLGNEYCRMNLLRDPNRIVAMAAIRSPRITDGEIVRASGNRTISEDVVRYIANQRDFVKMYAVKLNLVTNPKCPLALSLRMMPYLQNDDIKALARSKNVASALSTAARRLAMNRPGGQGGG